MVLLDSELPNQKRPSSSPRPIQAPNFGEKGKMEI
jgi:hypothetical protein